MTPEELFELRKKTYLIEAALIHFYPLACPHCDRCIDYPITHRDIADWLKAREKANETRTT